jgi:hypothetical protein
VSIFYLEYVSDNGLTAIIEASMSLPHSSPYRLTGIEGIHGLQNELHEIAPFQRDGAIFVSSRVPARTIMITGMIKGANVANDRRELLKIFDPKTHGKLTIISNDTIRSIDCIVEQAPMFSVSDGKHFTLGLHCPYPYYYFVDQISGNVDQSIQLTGWTPLFEFPASWEEPSEDLSEGGFELGVIDVNVSTSITNNGNVPVGMIITMYAAWDVSNPEVIITQTGEGIKFNLDMAEGDSLVINTTMGEKEITHIYADGTTENGMRYLDPSAKFIQLPAGTSGLRASAASGTEYLNVTLSFTPRYLDI